MAASPLTLALGCEDDASVPAALAAHGFWNTEAARRHLAGLAARLGDPPFAVLFLEALLGHLAASPDADMALNNFDRWSAQLPSPHATLRMLRENVRLFADLVTLCGSSQYLADILVREPMAYALLQEHPTNEQRQPEEEGQWSMVNGRWSMVNGQRRNHRPSTISHRPSTIDDRPYPWTRPPSTRAPARRWRRSGGRRRGWRRCGGSSGESSCVSDGVTTQDGGGCRRWWRRSRTWRMR